MLIRQSHNSIVSVGFIRSSKAKIRHSSASLGVIWSQYVDTHEEAVSAAQNLRHEPLRCNTFR